MTSHLLTCPYCNATVNLPSTRLRGSRVSCPSCGDSFEMLGEPDLPATAVTSEKVSIQKVGRLANWQLGGMVVAVMGIMASVAMAYALYTANLRRANDRALPNRPARTWFPQATPEEPVPRLTAPLLAGLGYLPPKSDIVVGLHLRDLVGDPVGQSLLKHTFRVGRGQFQVGRVADWLGIQPEAIDHAVLGLITTEPLIPGVVLIVRTRDRITPDQVQKAVKGEPIPGNSLPNTFRFRVQDLTFQPVIRWIDENTLGLSLIPSHLEQVPSIPCKGLDHLTGGLAKLIRDRVDREAIAWAAGEVNDQLRKMVQNPGKEENSGPMKNVGDIRSFAVGLRIGETIQLSGAIEAVNEPAAGRLLEWVAKLNGKQVQEGAWIVVQVSEKLSAFLEKVSPE